jgi:hypothetical protein
MHTTLIPPLTAFIVVLILGIIAILVSIIKENGPGGSAFWFYAAFWATCLALLL